MQPFRLHGLVAPEPARGLPPSFGRASRRRYGRGAPGVPADRHEPAPMPAPRDAEPSRWVDQEFEEIVFE